MNNKHVVIKVHVPTVVAESRPPTADCSMWPLGASAIQLPVFPNRTTGPSQSEAVGPSWTPTPGYRSFHLLGINGKQNVYCSLRSAVAYVGGMV